MSRSSASIFPPTPNNHKINIVNPLPQKVAKTTPPTPCWTYQPSWNHRPEPPWFTPPSANKGTCSTLSGKSFATSPFSLLIKKGATSRRSRSWLAGKPGREGFVKTTCGWLWVWVGLVNNSKGLWTENHMMFMISPSSKYLKSGNIPYKSFVSFSVSVSGVRHFHD